MERQKASPRHAVRQGEAGEREPHARRVDEAFDVELPDGVADVLAAEPARADAVLPSS